MSCCCRCFSSDDEGEQTERGQQADWAKSLSLVKALLLRGRGGTDHPLDDGNDERSSYSRLFRKFSFISKLTSSRLVAPVMHRQQIPSRKPWTCITQRNNRFQCVIRQRKQLFGRSVSRSLIASASAGWWNSFPYLFVTNQMTTMNEIGFTHHRMSLLKSNGKNHPRKSQIRA